MIPKAWAKLLSKLALAHPEKPHFHLWPTKSSSPLEMWHGMCPAVLAHVFHSNLPVWFTDVGYVTLQDGLLASDQISSAQKQMFHEAKISVVLVAEYLYTEACQLMEGSGLRPTTLCKHLRRAGSIENLSDQSRLVLLEFLLPGMDFTEFDDFAIFPFQDGTFRSLKPSPVFLHRDGSEQIVFGRQQERTIDKNQLTKAAARLFHEKVKKDNRTVRYRTTEDLRDYYLEHIFHGLDDIVVLGDREMQLLDKIWKWIFKYGEADLNLAALGSLWLVPLRDGSVRKLIPLDSANFVTWFRPGQTKDISIKLSASGPGTAPKVLAEHVLSDEVMLQLLHAAEKEPSLRVEDGNILVNFLDFLVQGRSIVQAAAGRVTRSILDALRKLYLAESRGITKLACEKFKNLCLFNTVEWPTDTMGLSVRTQKTNLTDDSNFIGLGKLVPIPPNSNYVFLNATEEVERTLLEGLGLLRCLNEVQILEEIVIPALKDGRYDKLNPKLRCEAMNVLFQNYYHLSASAQACLSGLPVVPMKRQKGESAASFGPPLDVLDPQKPELANLYFDNEIRYPEEQFYDRFRDLLARCGMIQFLSERVVLDRIQIYQKTGIEFDAVAARVQTLLEIQFRRDAVQPDDFTDTVRYDRWLPVKAAKNSTSFTNAEECRDICDQSVVGHVWHVLPFQVEQSWKSVFGWNDYIDVNVLMTQMVRAIAASDLPSVDQTLVYLHRHHTFESYACRLLDLNFVRSASGDLVSSAVVCRGGAERLGPYLHVVEPRFWDDHSQLMELAAVPELPNQEHLKKVQSALQVQEFLNEEDLDVATELARIWGARFCDSVDGLRLPTIGCVLGDIGDLSYNDVPWSPVEDHIILHPKIPQTIAAQLKIPLRSELLRNGALGIRDADDDEFDQREEVVDGIRDTLDRYTRESTFHEYIANSDDCGSASDVNFLFDGRTYSTKKVLTKELEALQGPSLFIHNNGGQLILRTDPC
jgi:sacsin